MRARGHLGRKARRLAAGWLAACAVGMAQPALAAQEDGASATVSVTGSAVLQVRPDLAVLDFGVEVEGPTAAQALADNSSHMQAVITAVRGAGIEEADISTAQFTIDPVYERNQDRESGAFSQTLRGYRVSNLLNVKVRRLEDVATIVDAAVAAGANRVDRLSYELSAAARERLDEELIERAVEDARRQARHALKPLDYQIVGVRHMVVDRGQPGPLFRGGARMQLAVESAPPVFAGEQEVRVTVNVTFEISRG